jgi:hypothetical protein
MSETETPARPVTSTAPPLPPLYSKLEALQSTRHRSLRLRDAGYGFARGLPAVPLAAEEFASACRHLPIVFTAVAPHMPVALTGLTADRNLLVEEDGSWRRNTYIPSYLRRFPFLLARISADSDEMALCIEAEAPQLSRTEGEPLFAEDKPSETAKRAVDFARAVEAAFIRTREMVDGLVLMGLLTPAVIQFERAGAKPLRVDGFHAVDREAFSKLSGEQLLTLHQKGWLECIYAHLLSLGGIIEFVQEHAATEG